MLWTQPLALAAAVIFLGLGCALILCVELMNRLSGVAFFDFTEMAQAFRAGETGRDWWVPAMVFSTVLPTGLHLGHALLSTLLQPVPLAARALEDAVGRAAYPPWAMVGAPLLVTGAVLAYAAMLYAVIWVPAVTVFEGTSALWGPAAEAMTRCLSLFERWQAVVSGWLS